MVAPRGRRPPCTTTYLTPNGVRVFVSPHMRERSGACGTRPRAWRVRVQASLMRADQHRASLQRGDRLLPRRRSRRRQSRASIGRSDAERRDEVGTHPAHAFVCDRVSVNGLGAPCTAMRSRAAANAVPPMRGTPSTSVCAVAACPFLPDSRTVHGGVGMDLSNQRCCRQRAAVCALRAQFYVERCSRANALYRVTYDCWRRDRDAGVSS